jgi:hypothetical protein
MVTKKNIDSFKKLYKEASGELKESFMFESQEVLTAYAKYIIEHWNNSHLIIDFKARRYEKN